MASVAASQSHTNGFTPAVADSATISSFPVNNEISQSSIFSLSLFIISVNSLLCYPSNPFHSNADDSAFHFSTHFKSTISFASRVAYYISSDLGKIYQWGLLNLAICNSLKLNFYKSPF